MIDYMPSDISTVQAVSGYMTLSAVAIIAVIIALFTILRSLDE